MREWWDERRSGENQRIRPSNLRKKPFPGVFDAFVWLVGTDVAAPHHTGPSALEWRDEGRGLGVMQDNDVAGSNPCDQRVHLDRRDTA